MRWMGRIGAADLITLANGFLGTLAITYVLDGEHVIASLLILLAVIADGLDGMVARRYGSPHEFGRFLDSISDAVSFCLAPGLIIYNNFYDIELGNAWVSLPNAVATVGTMFFVVFGLLRLARFAGKDYAKRGFLGLPTPAAAMIAISLCLVWGSTDLNPFSKGSEPYPVIAGVIILAFLMVSDIRYPKIRGAIRVLAGVAMVPGIVPLIVLAYGSEFPALIFYFLFIALLLGYTILGPIYMRKNTQKTNN